MRQQKNATKYGLIRVCIHEAEIDSANKRLKFNMKYASEKSGISGGIIDDIRIKQVLRDELINIYMMTEGVSVYPKFAQVFLCKRTAIPETQKSGYYLLDAKKSYPTFEMTDFGQKIIKGIKAPQAEYVAKVDCQLKVNVS